MKLIVQVACHESAPCTYETLVTSREELECSLSEDAKPYEAASCARFEVVEFYVVFASFLQQASSRQGFTQYIVAASKCPFVKLPQWPLVKLMRVWSRTNGCPFMFVE